MLVTRSLLLSLDFVATVVRIENTLRASDTDSVPSAESFLPLNGRVSGPLWHWALTVSYTI